MGFAFEMFKPKVWDYLHDLWKEYERTDALQDGPGFVPMTLSSAARAALMLLTAFEIF